MQTEITEEYAKGHFFEILEKLQQGQSFTITTDGRPIAQIRPPADSVAQANERLSNPQINNVPGETVLKWISQGRK